MHLEHPKTQLMPWLEGFFVHKRLGNLIRMWNDFMNSWWKKCFNTTIYCRT
jgi:hypothetical protein